MSLLAAVTDLADQAVVLPTVGLVGVWLVTTGWYRGAIAWLGVMGGVLGTVGVLKVLVTACRRFAGPIGLMSPSGHTVAAAMIASGIAVLLRARGASRDRNAIIASICAAVVIGLTRIGLGVHTLADVVTALPIGVAGGWLLSRSMGSAPEDYSFVGGIIVVAVTALLFYHSHAQLEPFFAHLAASLSCPFVVTSRNATGG